MRYHVKFNLFSGDRQYNKEKIINADSYDDARKKLLSQYPGALYIVIDVPNNFLHRIGNSPYNQNKITEISGNSLQLSDNYKKSNINITIGDYEETK